MIKEDKNRFMQMAVDLSQYALDSNAAAHLALSLLEKVKLLAAVVIKFLLIAILPHMPK
jgi:hypothetical protein